MDGFRVLVEKDWLAFGHPFQLRCAHGQAKGVRNDDQASPIFLQFLDCVAQLVSMFPSFFEFNGRYPMLVAKHIWSCRFGTFLGNTECERVAGDFRGRTNCLWTYLAENSEHLTSPYYSPSWCPRAGDDKLFLPPLSTILRRVKVWEYFLQKGPKETLAGVPERVARHKFPPPSSHHQVRCSKLNKKRRASVLRLFSHLTRFHVLLAPGHVGRRRFSEGRRG